MPKRTGEALYPNQGIRCAWCEPGLRATGFPRRVRAPAREDTRMPKARALAAETQRKLRALLGMAAEPRVFWLKRDLVVLTGPGA